MTEIKTTSYGSWKSPITSEIIASSSIRLDRQIVLDNDYIYWIETRPKEEGRNVIVRRSPDGRIADVTPEPYNARTRVHEYGGGAFLVDNGTVYFSNFIDQRLYLQNTDTKPQPITPEANLRYANGVIDHHRERIICVLEDHKIDDHEPSNSLVGVALDGTGHIQQLVSGNDFYSSPRISPDGSSLAWITWNHPNMPWNSTELWVGKITESGLIEDAVLVAGSSGESVCQPSYAPDGTLYFISERTGWFNLYRWRDGKTEPLYEMDTEFGASQWSIGVSSYGFESAERLVCAYNKDGTSYLASLDTSTGQFEIIDFPYTSITSFQVAPGYVVLLIGSPEEAASIVRLDLTTGKTEVLRRSIEVTIDPAYLSVPETIEFPTEHGLTAFAFYYKPKSRDFAAPPGERPPLLVFSHGGPTGATSSTLNLTIQYWTSRGFAVIDVNYGGSTGYGKTYRQRLDGQWGIVDVDDCVNCARYLIKRDEVDGERVAIRGGSAGGYTTLAALTFRSLFKAGASYYGIGDLEALKKDTHKFESRYLDRIIGPYPERRDLFVERSPINFVDRLSCPVIFFQGDEDKVVPPNQAEMMVDALRQKGMPVAYLLFEGEQHGFRKATNMKRAIEAELYFYSRTFGFNIADSIEPVLIENL